MIRIIAVILGLVLMSASVSGCSGDLTEYQQNEMSSEYRCTLQPGKRCRF